MAADPAQGRVTVLDLMAEASASVPDSGAAMRRPGEAGPPPPSGEAAVEAPLPAEGPDALLERVEELAQQLEGVEDPRARAVAEELMAATLEMHGRALARILELIDQAGALSTPLYEALVADGEVASLLLVHGLYPVDLETRVLEALDEVRPYMESHGGNVELLGLEGGIAHLKLQGSCEGCPASQATLELAIKKALMETAPDLEGIEVEGVEAQAAETPDIGGTPLPLAGAGNGTPAASNGAGPSVPSVSEWRELPDAGRIEPGAVAELAGLAVANVDGTLLAYLDSCAACGGPLHDGALTGGVLACPGCGRQFDLPKAGRPVEAGVPQLGPVPLLQEPDGSVRVALPA